MEKKLINEIDNFRLLTNYNTSKTLFENKSLIKENFLEELVVIIKNLSKGDKAIIETLFNKGIKDSLGNEIKDFKSLKDAITLHNISPELGKEIQKILINSNSKSSETIINNIVKSEGFIKKYGNLSVDEVKKTLEGKGYTPMSAQKIVNAYSTNVGKFAKPVSEILTKDITDLRDAVREFETQSQREILKNPALKSNLDTAKKELSLLKDKDLTMLSKTAKRDFAVIESIIKTKNPGLWTRITEVTSKMGWKSWTVTAIIFITLYGAKDSGALLNSIYGTVSSGLKNLIDGFKSGNSNSNGTTPDNGGENKVDWSKYK
jgi:hypothetical protein